MSHLDEGTIHAWLDGALPPDESARVEEHIRQCAECSALVAEARGFIAGASRIVSSLDVVRGDVIPPASPAQPAATSSIWKKLKLTPARAAIAATILVGVASMFSLRRQNDRFTGLPVRADSAMVFSPAAAPPAAPAPFAERRSSVDTIRQAPAPRSLSVPRNAAIGAAKPEAPAPAPAAPMAADARLRSSAESLALESVVVTAAPAQPQLSAAKAASRAAAAGAPASNAAADNVARRAFSTLSATTPSQAEGCYQLGVVGASAPRGIPDRFQLQHDSSNGRGIVRISLLGRDSVLSGATWMTPAPGSVLVSFADVSSSRVELSFATNQPAGTLIFGGRSVDATIQRTACER